MVGVGAPPCRSSIHFGGLSKLFQGLTSHVGKEEIVGQLCVRLLPQRKNARVFFAKRRCAVEIQVFIGVPPCKL